MLVGRMVRWRARATRPSRRAREFVMATIVTGEQYMKIDGKLHDIKRQLRQNGGYPHDPERLNRMLQAVVDGHLEFMDDERESYSLESDLVVDRLLTVLSGGGKITENVGLRLRSISDLEVVPFLRDKNIGDAVGGEEMRRRAVVLRATLGFLDAVFVLRKATEIPRGMSKEFAFTGTVLVNHDGAAKVACLRQIGWRWHFIWRDLQGSWFSHDHVARIKVAA